jgi:hypothetical protein
MRKRGAIGLPINILVIIIISLVIFAGGISLLYKMIEGAESAKEKLDTKTEGELRRLLEIESKLVALPLHTAYLYPGEFHYFGLGILNIGDVKEFYVVAVPTKAYDEKNVDIDLTCPPGSEEDCFPVFKWLLFKDGPYSIQQNEYELVPIGVKVPKTALKGTYIFNVKVSYLKAGTQKPYDNTKKFYVVVK